MLSISETAHKQPARDGALLLDSTQMYAQEVDVKSKALLHQGFVQQTVKQKWLGKYGICSVDGDGLPVTYITIVPLCF